MTRRRAILPLTIPAALSAALMFDCSPAATTDGGLEGGADVVANDTRDSASNDVSPDVRDVDADATVTTDASDALPPDAPDSSNTDAATDGGPSPCDPGYTSDGAGGCMDIDECTTGNGGCGTARCSNAPGSFHCFDNPLSLVLSGEVSTRIAGPGGSLHSALCPAGQLLIGLDSSYISGFGASSVSGVCAVATLTGTPAAGYSITVAPEPGGPSGQNPCPANEIVVGASIRVDSYITGVTVSCASLAVTFDAASGYAVTLGTPHMLPPYPASSLPPNDGVSCPSGTVANSVLTEGGQLIGGVGLQCTSVRFRFDVPDITFGATSDTPFVGLTGQTMEYQDDCPTGQLVTGIKLYDQMRAIAVQCGTPSIDVPPGVAIASGATLPWHGDLNPGDIRACPGALVGFSGYAGSWGIFQLALRCAPLESARTASGFDISVGASALYPNGIPMNFMTDCPTGTVAVGVASTLVRQSNSYNVITALGLRCARPGTM